MNSWEDKESWILKRQIRLAHLHLLSSNVDSYLFAFNELFISRSRNLSFTLFKSWTKEIGLDKYNITVYDTIILFSRTVELHFIRSGGLEILLRQYIYTPASYIVSSLHQIDTNWRSYRWLKIQQWGQPQKSRGVVGTLANTSEHTLETLGGLLPKIEYGTAISKDKEDFSSGLILDWMVYTCLMNVSKIVSYVYKYMQCRLYFSWINLTN